MKAKLLALVHGEYVSHTIKVLEIAKALRKTGEWDITFSGTGPYMKMAEDAGFKFIDTPTLPKRQINDILEKRLVPLIFTEENAERYYKVESELLEKHKPDVILRDHFRELAGIAAKEQGVYDIFIQLASCCPYYHFDFRPSVFPKILDKMLPEFITKPFRPITIPLIEKYIRKKTFRHIFNRAKKLKIPINKNIPEGYEADLVLLADEEKLFPLKVLGENYKFIGLPLSFDNYPNPEWLDLFIKDPRKKILVTGGSTGEHEKPTLFANTFKDKKFAVAVYSNDSENIENFYGCNQFNISEVLPYVDLFITHGGIGSTYLGLKNKIPMLMLPNHFEQEINAKQVEKIGAGVFLSMKKFSPKNIRKSIERILNDCSFKENAIDFSRTMTKNPLELAVKYINEGYKYFKKSEKILLYQ